MRHHDDRFALFLVQGFQQIKNFISGLAIEITRRFVAEQDGWIGDDRAGDADTLLFTARELARVVIETMRESDRRKGEFHLLAALLGRESSEEQGQIDISRRRENGQEIVHLEDESHVA